MGFNGWLRTYLYAGMGIDSCWNELVVIIVNYYCWKCYHSRPNFAECASRDQIWGTISSPSSLKLWHLGCKYSSFFESYSCLWLVWNPDFYWWRSGQDFYWSNLALLCSPGKWIRNIRPIYPFNDKIFDILVLEHLCNLQGYGCCQSLWKLGRTYSPCHGLNAHALGNYKGWRPWTHFGSTLEIQHFRWILGGIYTITHWNDRLLVYFKLECSRFHSLWKEPKRVNAWADNRASFSHACLLNYRSGYHKCK